MNYHDFVKRESQHINARGMVKNIAELHQTARLSPSQRKPALKSFYFWQTALDMKAWHVGIGPCAPTISEIEQLWVRTADHMRFRMDGPIQLTLSKIYYEFEQWRAETGLTRKQLQIRDFIDRMRDPRVRERYKPLLAEYYDTRTGWFYAHALNLMLIRYDWVSGKWTTTKRNTTEGMIIS